MKTALRIVLLGCFSTAIAGISVAAVAAQPSDATGDKTATQLPIENVSSSMHGRKAPKNRAQPLPVHGPSRVRRETSSDLQRPRPQSDGLSVLAAAPNSNFAVRGTVTNFHPFPAPHKAVLSGGGLTGARRQNSDLAPLRGLASTARNTAAISGTGIHGGRSR